MFFMYHSSQYRRLDTCRSGESYGCYNVISILVLSYEHVTRTLLVRAYSAPLIQQ